MKSKSVHTVAIVILSLCVVAVFISTAWNWIADKWIYPRKYDADMLYDPEINIKYGTLLLSLNIKEFGNTQVALASYNAGRTTVTNWLCDPELSSDSVTLLHIPYSETAEYVKKVAKQYEVYSKKLND